MSFNLKKSQGIAPIPAITDPTNDLNFIAASNKVLAMFPEYNNIQDFMTSPPLGLENVNNSQEVINYSESLRSEGLEDAATDIRGTEQAVANLTNKTFQSKNKVVKAFNLKKAQVPNPVSFDEFNETPEMMGDQLEEEQMMSIPQPPFEKIEDFRRWADNTDMSQVLQQVGGVAGDHLKTGMEQYYDADDEGIKGQIAAKVFSDNLFPLREEQGIMGTPTVVGEIEKTIKKLAQGVVNKNKKKVYNLTKTAQHKSLDNAILWGPSQSRIDPFLHQPVSDWHIVERNKGFGLVVDNIWNIDYETIWRNNIMDKYSRPYKNNDGEWVGGYLNKRFEIDRNIPETSNMQLKPGQTRRPILPEYGNTESRLQDARAKGDIEGAIDTSKPFNWKEASKKKS